MNNKLLLDISDCGLSKKEISRRKNIIHEFLNEEKRRTKNQLRLIEEKEANETSLRGLSSQTITGMPKGSLTVNYKIEELIMKKNAIEDEFIMTCEPSQNFNEILRHCNNDEIAVLKAMYTNRKRDYQISMEQNISESTIYRTRKSAVNKAIVHHKTFKM